MRTPRRHEIRAWHRNDSRAFIREPPYRKPDAAGALAEGDGFRATGNWIEAERAYLKALRDTLEDDVRATLVTRLTEAYAALGWPHHAARIAT